MREMLSFTDRKTLASMFDAWAEKNHVLKCGESMIAYLSGLGLIDEPKAVNMLIQRGER